MYVVYDCIHDCFVMHGMYCAPPILAIISLLIRKVLRHVFCLFLKFRQVVLIRVLILNF